MESYETSGAVRLGAFHKIRTLALEGVFPMVAILGSKLIAAVLVVAVPEGGSAWMYLTIAAASCAVAVALKARTGA
jgi:hypothetical protein